MNQINRHNQTLIKNNQSAIEIRRTSADGKRRGRQGDVIALNVSCYIAPVSGTGVRSAGGEEQRPQGFDIGTWYYGRFSAGIDLRNNDTLFGAVIAGLPKNAEELVLQVIGVRDYSNMPMNPHVSAYLSTVNS